MKLLTTTLLSVVLATVYATDIRETLRFPRSAVFKDSFGKSYVFDPVIKTNHQNNMNNMKPNNLNNMNNMKPNNLNNMNHMNDMNTNVQGDVLVRKRRLADDKKLDLKMKMQRVNKVVSLDAIGSYSLYRSIDRKTSLKAFGSTVLWYNGNNFGLKKPGLGVQFTIYY